MTQTTQDRTAIVTGAASGIGLATTQILLAQGWRVAGLDRDASALAAAEAKLEGHAGRFRLAEADVTDEARIAEIVAGTERDLGPIRGVVTSAGIGRNTSFFDTTPEEFRKVYDVNVVGTFIVARAAAEVMRASGGGAIVTVASISGIAGNVGRSAYGASKGAVTVLTRIMAVELARHGIRVNAVAPGPVETPMVETMHSAQTRALWNERVLLERYGSPAEIGEAAAFLLDGARASFITGQILAVDGGFTAAGLIEKTQR
jgi:NAD(P)-dependent dehydrogenase (short-subunit alcohol dehydrogenase family)